MAQSNVKPPKKPKKATTTSSRGATVAVAGAVAVVLAGGVAVWILKPNEGDRIERCLKTVLSAKNVQADEQTLSFASKAVASGKLEIGSKSSGTTEFRVLSDPVLLAALEVCRAAYVSNADTPSDVAHAPREALIMTPVVTVEVKRGSRTDSQEGARVFSTDERVRACNTDRDGQCTLTLKGVRVNETIQLKASKDGIVNKSATVPELLTGVTIQMLPSSYFTILVERCDKQTFIGKVQIDAPSAEFAADGCANKDGHCREAATDDNGKARFRYDPESLKRFKMHAFPTNGPSEEYDIPNFGELVSVKYPKECPVLPDGGGRPPTCTNATVAKLKNSAVSVVGQEKGSVSFTISSKTVKTVSGPSTVTLQLQGKSIDSADCSGSFQIP